MAWDFETEPEFQKQLDWVDQFVREEVEPLDFVLGSPYDLTDPQRQKLVPPLQKRVQQRGRHKKQSGGHGQFAVVQLRVSPMPLGGGFEFVDSVVGGAVPRSYIPAVEKGAHDALAGGGPQGHPVVDVRVELVDGKSHSVDSSEMAFQMAGALALKEAAASAQIRERRAAATSG